MYKAAERGDASELGRLLQGTPTAPTNFTNAVRINIEVAAKPRCTLITRLGVMVRGTMANSGFPDVSAEPTDALAHRCGERSCRLPGASAESARGLEGCRQGVLEGNHPTRKLSLLGRAVPYCCGSQLSKRSVGAPESCVAVWGDGPPQSSRKGPRPLRSLTGHRGIDCERAQQGALWAHSTPK